MEYLSYQHLKATCQKLERYYFLHIYFSKTQASFDPHIWLTTLIDSYPLFFTGFQQNAQLFILVIDLSQEVTIDLQALEAILNTLNDDFSESAYFMVGQKHSSSTFQKEILELEQQSLVKVAQRLQKQKIYSLPQVLLQEISCQIFDSKIPIPDLANQWNLNQEEKKIIIQLFNRAGNISQTASDLYLHRNSLNYRIKKINQKTGLTLQEPADLVILYLIASE